MTDELIDGLLRLLESTELGYNPASVVELSEVQNGWKPLITHPQPKVDYSEESNP